LNDLTGASFPAAGEEQLLKDLASELVPRAKVLGVDRFGLDIEIERRRVRQTNPRRFHRRRTDVAGGARMLRDW